MSRHRLYSLTHRDSAEREDDPPRDVTLARRARKHTLRGEGRQAMLALKEACFVSEQDARLWALYAVSCWRMRRHEDAARAFRQAIYLRSRDGSDKRVQVLKDLLAAVGEGGAPRAVIAA